MKSYNKLAYPYFAFSLFIGAFLPFLSLYLHEKEFNPWQIGVVTSLFILPKVFSPYFWGWLTDKYKCTAWGIRFAYIASLICLIPFFYQLSFVGMCIVILIMSFFWSGITPLLEALTISYLGKNQAYYGRVRLWASISYLIAVTATGYLIERFNISHLIYLWFAIKVFGLFSFPFIKEPSHPLTFPNHHLGNVLDVGTVLKKMDVVLFLLAAFLMAFAHSTYGSYYSLLLTNFGYESHTIGWLFAIGVISEIGVFIYMPTIMRYFSLKQILIFSFICAIVRYLLIGTFVSSLPILIFAQLLHGATFGAYHASAINLISRIFPVTDNAKGQAILTIFSSGLGGVLGSLVAGGIWQIYGGKIVFLILSLIACCGTIIMFFAFKGQHVSRSASLH